MLPRFKGSLIGCLHDAGIPPVITAYPAFARRPGESLCVIIEILPKVARAGTKKVAARPYLRNTSSLPQTRSLS